ncbi:type II toxin-antitoxin system RelB/DinJ family antitoxin [Bifidobacterium aquikefiricola]|uniref:Type II toxin-antitoxin system RelB/DinJ family antitoxin n=1 Tax=Bifidobacterium aquikefiricola TaxID=3059038 RepID=A0AB39U665_9BIFI
MSNTPTTTMCLDPELKNEAMRVLKPLWLNMTGVVTLLLKAVVRENGLPFGVTLGNKEKDGD